MDKPKLLEQTRSLLRLNCPSVRTQKVYLSRIKKLILFRAKRCPRDPGEEEIPLPFRTLPCRVSASTQVGECVSGEALHAAAQRA